MALVITIAYNVFFMGIRDAGDVVLALLNAMVVTGASSGLFEGVVKPVAQKVGAQK